MLPILFQSHEFILYSYPLFMGMGWGIAYQIFFSLTPENYPRYKLQLLFWGIFLFAWLGAKLLFYLTYPDSNNILAEVSFWTGGGFVFYGGFLGGILYLLIYKFLDKSLNLSIVWSMLPALSIGHGIGRIGCFLAGCCYGKPTDWFWSIHLHGSDRHPTQLIEASGLLFLGAYLLRSKTSKLTLLANYLLFYGGLRLFIEALRGDVVRGEWGLLTPSQWISLILILAGIVIKFKKIKDLA